MPPKIFNSPETWPTTGEETFGHPPLESARSTRYMNWRGVRLRDVANELYYERDGIDFARDTNANHPNVCAATGEPPDLSAQAVEWLYKNAPGEATWDNMVAFANLSYLMIGIAMPEAHQFVTKGLTNAVPIDQVSYEAFHLCEEDEQPPADFEETATLTLAISYAHKSPEPRGLLKANDMQIAQLRDILSAIRSNPPMSAKFVRLWTDQALSKSLVGITERPSWILYGLLPYTIYTVATLYSGDESDSASMWSACEQILADGGSGCIFSIRSSDKIPDFCKHAYCGHLQSGAVKSVGDGLSINRNLTKLASCIHSGLLDDSVTYHIGDAQQLMRLAYYMVRPGVDVSLFHAVNCQPCLDATFREHMGFYSALGDSADVLDKEADAGLRMRLNRTRVSYAYPKVRARRGYADWHGVREFLPGAGRFAKFLVPELTEHFRQHIYYARVRHNGSVSEASCFAISASPLKDKVHIVRYIVLYVYGRDLFGASTRIDYSTRMNIVDVDKLHNAVQSRKIAGKASDYFRHPLLDELLGQLEITDITQRPVFWGQSKAQDSGAAPDPHPPQAAPSAVVEEAVAVATKALAEGVKKLSVHMKNRRRR